MADINTRGKKRIPDGNNRQIQRDNTLNEQKK